MAAPSNGGFDLTCLPSISVTPRDPNPVASIHIFGHLVSGHLRDIEVELKLLNGATYYRSRQYTVAPMLGAVRTEDTEILALGRSGTWNRDRKVVMTGRVGFYKSGNATYTERQTKNGVQASVTITGCAATSNDAGDDHDVDYYK